MNFTVNDRYYTPISPNGYNIATTKFRRLEAFLRQTKMHSNKVLLIKTEFCKKKSLCNCLQSLGKFDIKVLLGVYSSPEPLGSQSLAYSIPIEPASVCPALSTILKDLFL